MMSPTQSFLTKFRYYKAEATVRILKNLTADEISAIDLLIQSILLVRKRIDVEVVLRSVAH
jgi:hypothetical protein